MRKAVLVAVLAAALAPFQPASAANKVEDFKIKYPVPVYPVPGGPGAPGVIGAQCLTQGTFTNSYHCQKSTWARLARCVFLEARASAQTGRQGEIGYLFRIDATKVRGVLDDDRDNNTFDLIVLNKIADKVGGTLASVPDVDISFLQSLGGCVADVETPAGAIGLGQSGPTPLKESIVARATYNTYGDEIGGIFPSGKYADPNNPTSIKVATSYWAIVTLTYGSNVDPATVANTSVRMRCKDILAQGATRRDCADGWFIQV